MSNTLPTQINTLRSALSNLNAAALDRESRAALTALHGDLGRLLNAPHHESVAEKLEELAVRFEADHPAVGTAIREVVNTLVKAGI